MTFLVIELSWMLQVLRIMEHTFIPSYVDQRSRAISSDLRSHFFNPLFFCLRLFESWDLLNVSAF